jgi:plasmid stabilization system protein ParE
MAEIELARRAVAGLRRLRAWLADKDPDAAARAAEAIAERIQQLRAFPRLGPMAANSETRELQVRFGRYGYVVRYVLRGDIVVITRVFHGREDR